MVYLMLAEGFEEVEAVTVADLLRRAEIEVSTVSVSGNKEVSGSHGISVRADLELSEAELTTAEMVVLPGGMPGTVNLASCRPLADALLERAGNRRPVAAICAAPMVLGQLGILKGKRATIYRGMEAELCGAEPVNEKVVTDDFVITSQGPGTAMDFGLALIAFLKNKTAAEEVREGLLYR